MSIIVALASSGDGVVASDSRQFGPARLEAGQVVGPATVSSDEFDKTFALCDGTVIGAFCGLLSFSGQRIPKHIAQIIGTVLPDGAGFDSIVERIGVGMVKKLGDEREVIFSRRKVDLLLVAGEPLVTSGVSIAAVQFFPDNDRIVRTTEILPVNRRSPSLVYKIFGDDRAQAGAKHVFRVNQANNRDVNFLRRLAEQAISASIRVCGPHPDGSEPACGGRVFTETMRKT